MTTATELVGTLRAAATSTREQSEQEEREALLLSNAIAARVTRRLASFHRGYAAGLEHAANLLAMQHMIQNHEGGPR